VNSNPQQILELPGEAPVMVLPNTVLIPNALLPLRIFEQQYRDMLSWCVEHDRLFCIAMRDPERDGAKVRDFLPVGGIGLIRACVGQEDGTSNLALQGLARVKFGSLVQRAPFRVAKITVCESELPNLVEAEALGVKVLEICGRLFEEDGRELPEALMDRLRQVTDPELLADLVTQTFLREPQQQQSLMEELSVSERLRLLIRYLQAPGVTG
jgi:Lon protease-like protein